MRKTSTRVLSAIMAVLMLVGLVPMMSISSSAAFNDTSMKFDENGDFTVIQIADIQDDTEVHETTLALISKAMNKYNPDLVVLTGDNVQSGMDEGEFKSSASQFMAPIIAAGVRYAVTFGNHDAEDKSIVNTAWDKQSQYNHFIGMSSLSVDFDENSLSGVGTGSIPIYSNDGSRVAFCVFPIDSGMYDSNDDYDYVKDDQIAWYASEADRLATLNNGNKVPTLVFQHIPVPEIYSNLLVECASTDPGAVTGQTPNYSGKYWRLDPNNPTITGVMGEGPCPPTVNNGQYQGWLDVGNVVGAFFGHDHKNDFVGTDANGITMGYCKAATLEAYHSDDNDPAVRVFNIKEDGTYTTQSVTYSTMQQEETEDYERDEISGTPTVPEVLYVGAADNSIAKQEYGTTIQLQSLNHKTQSMYNNDLTVTIDLNKAATDVTLSAQGISFSPVSVTENEASNTYTWTITGGSANAGNVVEYEVNYNFEGTAYVQYAYSYVDNIKSPPGHYVYVRNYGGLMDSNDAYWNTQTYVMTILGKNVYGHARSTTDDSYADLGAWTNAPAGYYNYTGTADEGFVQKDVSYGLNYCSPSRIRTHAEFPRFQQAGKSPVATIYADTSVSNSLTDLGISVNYWRHYTPQHNVQPTIQFAFKPGDASYAYNTWNTDTVGSSTISVQNASIVLPAARGSNVSNAITGGAIPADGTTYTLISYASSHYDGGLYATNVYTFMPVLLKFVTYNKADLRALLNAERTANRQLEGDDLKNTSYRQAFKEAFKQIQKPDTNQADINNAKLRLEKAIENLTFSGADISGNNSEYYMNPTVPPILYVAGSGYGLAAQPKGTTVQPSIVNFRTRAMVSYTNFKVTLPNGATNALVEVYNQNTGAAMTFTWDPATASGAVTGGTANTGDVIVYKFTYELGGKTYIQYEASTVTDAPQGSGWLTYIRRKNGWGTNQTSQESIIFFAPEGVPAEGIQYEALQGNAGYDNAYYGVNLTNFNGDNSQKVAGFGINSWTGPSKQTNGGWYCGDEGKDDTKDGGYRAKFNLYFDTSLPVNLTQAKMLFTAIGLRTQGDAATIHQNGETYYSGQGNHPNYGENVGTINSAAYDDAGNVLSEATFNDAQGDLMYRYMLFDTVPTGEYTYYTYMWAQNGSKNAITCHYAWHINIIGIDKTDLRNLVAQENQIFRQYEDGYSDTNGKWTAYVNALAKAKGAVHDASLTAAENATIEANLQTAISQLEYVRADYTELEKKIAQICEIHYDENGNRYYHYRPNEIVDPLYYNREEYYPVEYFNVSVNEMNVPLDEILDNKMNLDIRYQDEVDSFIDVLDIGWQSAQLRNADYSVVDSYLELKTGTNPNGSTGGLTIILPDLEKYEFVGADFRDVSWENFTTDSYNAWANACAPAMSNRSLKSPDQPIVDGYATALETAYNALELKPADYTALNNKIAEATSNIDTMIDVVDPANAENNYQITYYDPDYLAQIREKCAEKVEGLYILQQEEVDVLEYEIDQLYVALGNHLNEADFTFANQQKDITVTYEASPLVYYTEASWNRLVAARAAVVEAADYGYMAGEQPTVNALAQEVYDARNALTYNTADYSNVNAWLAKIAELEPTKSDYANWSVVEEAVAAVQTGLDITYQAAVDTMAQNLETAYNSLKLKDADYSKLNNKITAAQALMANQALYTPGTYANFLAVYNEALTFYMAEPKVDIQHQETVDAMEAKLDAAMAQLDYIDANIAPLEDAVSYYLSVDYYAYEAEYPTDTDGDGVVDVYEDAEAKYQAAQALLDKYAAEELDIRNDAEIKAAADTLTAAVNNLPALYADVDWEIENIPADYYTTPEKYTVESRAKLAEALAAVDRNLKIGDQDKIYEYAAAINTAVAGLEENDANLDDLKAAITAADQKIAGVDTNTYTDTSWAVFEAAYNDAADIRDADPALKYSEQAEVDAATAALVSATAGLKKKSADYSKLDEAIARADELNKDDWSDETWAELIEALNKANSLPKDLTVDDQAQIDAAVSEITEAITKLEEADVPCNYTALDTAIAKAATADTTNCTSASVAEFNAALAAAQAVARDLIVDDAGANQAMIDAAAERLEKAITGLTKLGNCDYEALDAAIAQAAKADTTNCTSASVAEFNAALAAAQAVARDLIADEAGANQATVDAAAARLNKAITGLTKLGNCNYAELDAAMADYEAKLADKDIYTNWAEYEAAYNAANAVARDLVDDEAGANQKAIDDAAAALKAVVLEYKAADYSAVEAAKAKIPADMSTALYTAASVKAVEDAVAAVVEGYDITKQAEVNAMAAAIEEAVAELVKLGKVDYSALDEAINKVPADVEDAYSTATWEAYQEALEAANNIDRDLINDEAGVNQAKVNEAAKALADAFANLADKEFCDYSALEEMVLYCSELDADEEYYDAADLAEWKSALAAAKALLAAEKLEKTVDNQAIIDNAAATLGKEYSDLYELYVDLDALAAAVDNYGEHKIEYEIERYTADSWAAYEAALAAAQQALVDYDLAPDIQETRDIIAGLAKDLEDAYNALELIKGYCDYTALEEAVLYCSELDADEVYYDAAELAEWKAALAEAKTLLEGEPLFLTDANQAMIDSAAGALEKEYGDLYELYVDLDALAAAVESYGEHKIENEIERYTVDSWAAYEAALAAAEKALVDYDLAPDTQDNRDAVAKAAKDLEDAYNALELITGYCDYTALEEAVLYCSELDADEDYYDATELAEWKAALADAKALLEGDPLYLTDANQAIIDDAATALINEYSDLYEMYVDLEALAAAVESYGEHKVENEIERYTPDSWAAYEAALAAAEKALVDYDLAPDTQDNRDAVAKAAQDLEVAYKSLTILGNCDYSELNAAIADYEAKLADKDLYVNWAEYEAAYNAAQAVDGDMIADAAGENQAKIDAAADALNAVVLVYKDADYSAVEAAKAKIPADLNDGKYTAASVKAVEDAVAAVVEGYDITKQAEVDAMAAAIEEAVAKLAKLGSCDYSELDEAIADYEAKLADKDLYANWAEYEAAYNAAKAVERDMIADEAGANQKAIDDAADALNAVVLVYKDADYSAVEAAKAKIPADLSSYTADSVKAVEDAVAAVVEGYDITKQAEVDAMAAAIEDAVAKLTKKPADYTDLQDAIDRAEALNKDDWSPETWAAVVDAYTAATGVSKDLTVDDQATVDAAAEALNKAIDNLAEAEVPIVLKAKAGSTTVIDRERGFIYGLSCVGVDAWSEYEFVTDLLAQNFVEIEGDGSLRYTYVGNNTVLGTGAKVELINNKTGEVIETFYIVIFGDIDGDGTVTYTDAVDAYDYMVWNECIHDYEDFTDPAVFAADIDNDGVVTYNDFVVCNDYIVWNCDAIPQVR